MKKERGRDREVRERKSECIECKQRQRKILGRE
jgi:hypothetical protein